MFELIDIFGLNGIFRELAQTFSVELRSLAYSIFVGVYFIVVFWFIRSVTMRLDYFISNTRRFFGAEPMRIQFFLEPFLIRIRQIGLILAFALFVCEVGIYVYSYRISEIDRRQLTEVASALDSTRRCIYRISDCGLFSR